MNKKDELYPHLAKGLDRARNRIANSEIMEENKKSLLDFLVKLEADGTGKPQIISYVDRLRPIAELIGNKPFREVTKREMETVFAEYRKRGLSKSSLNKTVECLKAFYRWVYDLSSQDPAPEVVRWLKRENVPNGLRSEDLWTDSDMEKVMNSTRSLKDKCIMSVLFEAGLRPGELRGLKIKDVVVKKDMVNLYVAGKTERIGGERVVPLLRSYNIMRMWLSQHPNRDKPESWLWTFNGKPLLDRTLRIQIRRIGERAGITKPLNPYILRHTALTRFYKNMPGTVASKLAGHSPGSKQAQTYCHLAVEDLEDSVRELNGAPRKKQEEETKRCHKCDQTLAIGDRICPACGLAQDDEMAAKRMEDTEEALNVMAGIKSLGTKYPELGELINGLLNKENLN